MPSVAVAESRTSSETVFTWAAPPLVFGRGAFDELGHHAAALGLRRVAVVSDPGLAATDLPGRAVRSLTAAGIASITFTGVHIEPTDESLREARRMGPDRAPGRLGRRRWRVGDRHGQGDEPARDERRRPGRVPQPADRCRSCADAASRPAHRHADDGRDGCREHAGLHPGYPRAPGEDRHQPPGAPPATGHRRPADDHVAAARRDHRERDGRPVPRPRVVYGPPVRCPAEARRAGVTAGLQRLEPHQRHLGDRAPSACSAAGSAAPSTSLATSRRARG